MEPVMVLGVHGAGVQVHEALVAVEELQLAAAAAVAPPAVAFAAAPLLVHAKKVWVEACDEAGLNDAPVVRVAVAPLPVGAAALAVVPLADEPGLVQDLEVLAPHLVHHLHGAVVEEGLMAELLRAARRRVAIHLVAELLVGREHREVVARLAAGETLLRAIRLGLQVLRRQREGAAVAQHPRDGEHRVQAAEQGREHEALGDGRVHGQIAQYLAKRRQLLVYAVERPDGSELDERVGQGPCLRRRHGLLQEALDAARAGRGHLEGAHL
mmetsp:Transcript_2883/g.8337  ORF Transcript_2883/g.8337 Transcript_2883/m.8337 type:complete len:269 (+) Transcript_2883:562-1368(+)